MLMVFASLLLLGLLLAVSLLKLRSILVLPVNELQLFLTKPTPLLPTVTLLLGVTFGVIDSGLIVDTYKEYVQAFIVYAKTVPQLVDLPPSEYST